MSGNCEYSTAMPRLLGAFKCFNAVSVSVAKCAAQNSSNDGFVAASFARSRSWTMAGGRA
eukprot:scaffold36008_cov183-Amphora_coffeaeformis.AAC.1